MCCSQARSHCAPRSLVVAVFAVLAAAPAGLAAQQASPQLDSARTLLARYKDPFAAVHDGYLSTVACLEFPTGAMGVHFVNFQTIGPKVELSKPQVLIYEPVGDSLRLAAAEWFVPLATGVTAPPVLFGETFDGPMDGHQPLMPRELAHYDLHVWLFKDNPKGVFSPVNPAVSCKGQAYAHHDHLPETIRH